MRSLLYKILLLGIILLPKQTVLSQEIISLEDFLGYVKGYHPFLKQANLKLSESQAKLLKSRGAFDPKFQLNQKEKTFEALSYYTISETSIDIPTYYGFSIELSSQQAEGTFLNPENSIKNDRLYGIGASVDLGKGLLSNPRQTALKQAKIFTKQAKEENALQINSILNEASHAYLDWYKAYKSYEIYTQFVTNAKFRFEGVKKRMLTGDMAIIDTIEARIAYQQRILSKENARLELRKKAFETSNFIWINEQAVMLNEGVSPKINDQFFNQNFMPDTLQIIDHPKIRALEYKQQQLQLEKRLQLNNLLPEVTLQYQWLSETDPLQNLAFSIDPNNNTTGLKVAIPLFLRKERANLKLASFKLEGMELEQAQTKTTLQNKINSLFIQSKWLEKQKAIANEIVNDYHALFEGEKKKFLAGESSLFLVNARESNLIEAMLRAIAMEVALKKAQITYYYEISFPDYSGD